VKTLIAESRKNGERDTETSSRLIPFVDELTHILIEAGKNNCTDAMMMQPYKGDFIDGSALPVHPFNPDWYVGDRSRDAIPGRQIFRLDQSAE
jgi:hypothetical protein